MAKWFEVCGREQVPPGGRICVAADSQSVVLCDIGGQLTAVENCCPHAGLPLADGELRGEVLTCAYHGYTYNVRTGKNVDFPNEEPPVRTFNVEVRDGRVWVEIKP